MRMKFLPVAAVAAALLALPAASGAATTIGNDLEVAPTKAPNCGDCTAVERLGPASPVSGVITRWRVRSGSFGQTVTLRVIRVDNKFNGTSTGIATGQPQILSLPLNTFTSRLPIKAGETIGIDSSGNPTVIVDTAAQNNIVRFLQPLANGETRDPGQVVKANGTLAINADVEPDADGDGFGDETQDGCPTDAAKQGSCQDPPGAGGGSIADLTAPRISVSFKRRFELRRALRAGRRGALAGRVRSNEAGRILAQAEIPGRTARRLGLQRSRTRTAIVARASGRLASAGSRTVKFRFTRRARRVLAARRRVALTLRFTVRDEAGNPSVATRRVTLARRG